MEPSHPVVSLVVIFWGVLCAVVLPLIFVVLKKFTFLSGKKFLQSQLLAVVISPFVNLLGLVLTVFTVLAAGMMLAQRLHLTFMSVFLVWCVFWYLVSILIVLFFFKKLPRPSKEATLVPVVLLVAFCVFIVGVFGINRLREQYKYCSDAFICKRQATTYVANQQPIPSKTLETAQPKDFRAKITAPLNDGVLLVKDGFVEIKGTANPGQAVFFEAGFKNPDEWRYGRESGTLSLEPVKANEKGEFTIRIEHDLIPKGVVYLAAFTSVDSDVPWASKYNASVVKVTHSVLQKPVITTPKDGTVVKEFPVTISGRAAPGSNISIFTGYTLKELECITHNTYASGGSAQSDAKGNFTTIIAEEAFGSTGKRTLMVASLPKNVVLGPDVCFPKETLSNIIIFDYQGKIISE